MQRQIITATLECDKDGTWYFVHVPKKVRGIYKEFERRGATAIEVTVGSSTWQASILPWADGSGQISINKRVREKEGLKLGERLEVEIMSRERS